MSRPDRGAGGGVPAAPRPRPPHPALAAQLPRQHRRAKARRGDRDPVAERLRLVQGRAAAGHLRHRRSVHRPHIRARKELLRHRVGGPCGAGGPGLRPPRRPYRGGARPARRAASARRHLSHHGGTAVLDPRRVRAVPELGLRRHRHDQHAGGEARPRSRDVLRDGGDGDRLRLLASASRRRHRRGHYQAVDRERRQGAGAGQGAPRALEGARGFLRAALPHRARRRPHHRPGRPRSGTGGAPRRRRRAGC